MSQGSANVPTVGPVAPTNFAGDINTALDALFTKNSGASAPTNFPVIGNTAAQGEEWWDTSPGSVGGATFIDGRVFDGGVFVRLGSFDITNHTYMPKVGGGTNSISASAGGTIDLGSIRASFITLSSPSLSNAITGFGSNAILNTGEMKTVICGGPGIITYNATSMILPGLEDLWFNTNDTFMAVYLGGGNWRVLSYSTFNGRNWRRAQILPIYATGALPGAVRANGRTIGDASSNATELADPTAANLYIELYIRDSNLNIFTSGGVLTTRTAPGNTRAAAVTDFNLHKQLALPDGRLRGIVGLGDMGNSDVGLEGGLSFLNQAGGAANGITLGATVGESVHTTTIAESKPHNHVASSSDSGHQHGPGAPTAGTNPTVFMGAGGSNPTVTIPGGTAVTNMQEMALTASASASITTTINAALGASVTVTSASPGVVTWTSHGLSNGAIVQFDATASLPTGISPGTNYYVTVVTSSTFKVSSSLANYLAGTFVNTSSTGSGVVAWAAHNNMPPSILTSFYLAL